MPYKGHALRLSAESDAVPFHLTYESMLAAGDGETLAIPPAFLNFLSQNDDHRGPDVGLTLSDSQASKVLSATPRLAAKISNFDECRTYFKRHAPMLLFQLLEPSFGITRTNDAPRLTPPSSGPEPIAAQEATNDETRENMLHTSHRSLSEQVYDPPLSPSEK